MWDKETKASRACWTLETKIKTEKNEKKVSPTTLVAENPALQNLPGVVDENWMDVAEAQGKHDIQG